MKKYTYDPPEFNLIEQSVIPFAIYQFVNKRVVTIALSKGFMELFGFDDRAAAYELMDNDMYRDAHPDDVGRISDDAVRFATEGGKYNVIYRSKISGEYHIIHAFGEHIYREDNKLAVIWYTDEGAYDPDNISQEKSLNKSLNDALREQSIYHQIKYDHLTGLPSMTYFLDIAEAAHDNNASQGIPTAMLFIDLNGMKHFNRKYGLAEGDKLIRSVGRLLITHFGENNCSRFGGDHFAVLSKEEGLTDKLKVFFKDCEKLNDGRTLPVRVGIYYDKYGKVAASTACDWAKIACDKDRSFLRSHYRVFDEKMHSDMDNRQYIIDNIDRAIAEGWIQVYYQPIVRASNGRVCDEEALARWIDPEKGFLTPDKFIPVLEDSNLIYKLDLFITDKILEKMKDQAYAGLFVVPMSVNLSRSDFDSCDMVEEIRKRTETAGISPDMLTIEITESVVGNDFDYIKTQVERFQSLGFKVWMDDFGSGYSSLDVLQSIRFDLIKLDMRFMQEFDKGEKTKIILTELIRMAMGLGIDTVVEGVETAEQVEFLREIGAAKLQGFYFCKPVPYEEILNRNREGRQIGFENPDEAEYFETLGRINLYDMSRVTNNDEDYSNYFATNPMSIVELDKRRIHLIRGNAAYRDFFAKYFSAYPRRRVVELDHIETDKGKNFYEALLQSADDGKSRIIDETLFDASMVHLFIRRIAKNPVTRVVALVIAVLSISDRDGQKGK